MDSREILRTSSELVAQRRFREAEEFLVDPYQKAIDSGDIESKKFALSELIELYCITEPPNFARAEILSAERESLGPDAMSRLQTAMLFYYSIHDYGRAESKLREAIELGRTQNDQRTVYTSLALLGKTLLDEGRTSEAIRIFSEIERMVFSKQQFVVGDETQFLETLRARGLESERVTRLASSLAPICRDPAFKQRLEVLAIGT